MGRMEVKKTQSTNCTGTVEIGLIFSQTLLLVGAHCPVMSYQITVVFVPYSQWNVHVHVYDVPALRM